MEKDVESFSKNVRLFASKNRELEEKLLNLKDETTAFCRTGEKSELNLILKDHLGNSCYLHSDQNISQEMATWYASLSLLHSNVLYMYGVGLGYVFETMKDWLGKSPEHYLVFFEDDIRIIHSLLGTELGSELICHPQVKLYDISNFQTLEEILDRVSFSLVFQRCLVSALPFYQSAKRDRFTDIQLLISSFSYRCHISREFLNFGRSYYANAYRNALYLPFAYSGAALFGKFKNVPAIVCGAGPSLDRNFEVLQQLGDRALLFSGSTSLDALSPGKVQPHFGVGIDPNPFQVSRLLMSNAFEAPFFFHLRWNHEAFRLAYGPHLLVGADDLYQTMDWINNELGLQEAKVDTGYNVVNFSLSLAYALGCNPIILVGVDQAYHQNQSYASTVYPHPLSQWQKEFFTKDSEDELLVKKDIEGNPVYTLWKWIKESWWISRFAREHSDVQILNATEGGIGFSGIPNLTLAEVKEKFLTQSYDLKGRIHAEIQRAKMPKSVTIDKILEIYERLTLSLTACEALCKTLSQGYYAVSEQLRRGETASFTEEDALQKLEGELAYVHILALFKEMFFKMNETLFHPSLHLEERACAIKEAVTQDNLYRFLHKTVQENLRALHLAKLLYKKDQDDFINSGEKGKENCSKGKNGTVFPEDQRDGIREFYGQNGQKKIRLPYQSGLLEGVVQMFYPSGQLHREIPFHMGKRHGKERMWDEKGGLLQEVEYEENNPVGKAKQWHHNGTLIKEVEYLKEDSSVIIRRWNREGEPLPERRGTAEDYFESLFSKTNFLTNSLNRVFNTFQRMLSLRESFSDSQLEQAGAKELRDRLEEIGKEIEHLKSLSQEIEVLSKGSSQEEALWKTPMSKQMLELYLQTASEKLSVEMEQIRTTLKLAAKRLKNGSGL